GVGEGWAAHAAALAARIGGKLAGSDAQRVARALDVALLAKAAHARGEGVPAWQALPVYVRNRVARKRGE
ncbi:MAG: tRNA (adenosine(37)-N6)-threonylcarbamoyltransferase complex dimerization subunit type 1 TsaB, partial [Gammaproteobacteria bacterium]|nr:tRNA (adenosine(37)-N6)-threonylcarbamoyltransferase complex dimerization subunit type 1 TsaB [Gammaproteobacteria bacterium]